MAWPFSSPRAPSPRVEPTIAMPRNSTLVASSDPRIMEIFGEPTTVTGRAVTETTAMRVSAVYACVRIIAGALATMPLDLYRREANGVRTKLNEQDDLWWLLNEQPHARWTASSMWKWLAKSEMLRGDGFARIGRTRNGVPYEIEPLVASGVVVEAAEGRLRYFYTDDTGRPRGLDQDDVIHIPGFGFDGLRGMSAIQWGARNGIGIALATDEFSGRFFGDGAMVKHAIRAEGKMDQALIDQLREQWAERYSGLDNAFKPIVLTQGLDVKELSLSAEDSQLLEARKFQVIDIARAFGVPPFMIGETEKTSSWGSGVEHMSLGFVKYTLQDRMTTIEQELNRKLFRTSGRLVKFNADEMLRGDSAARAKFLRELVGGSQGPGVITQNEARATEGFAPKVGGDVLYDPTKAPKPAAAPPP
jgi:HK97 family phage portal protein